MLLLNKIVLLIFSLSVGLLVHAEEIKAAPDKVELTAKEQAWLAKHKSIRIGYDDSLPPYSFINESGQYEGIAIEVMAVLSQKLGINFKEHPNSSWNSLYRAAAAHKVDIIATMVDRPERRLWFRFTEPYLTKSLVIVTRQDNKTIKSRKDLKNKAISLVSGYKYGEIVQKDFPSAKSVKVDTMLEGLEAVANGTADAAVIFMGTNKYLQSKYKKEDLKVVGFYDRKTAESIAIRKDWPILVGILQKGLDSSQVELKSIYDKWVSPEETKSDPAPTVIPTAIPNIESTTKPTLMSTPPVFWSNFLVPSLTIMSFLLAWLFHAHTQNRKIIQSNKQVLLTNSNLEALQRDLEHLVLKRTAELNSSEQKFRSLVENLRNEYFFYHHDNAGVFTYVSPSITNILGYEPEEFIAHYREYLTDNSINQKIDEYTELSSQGVPSPPYQIEIYDRKKIVHWLEIADSPVYDEYGNCIGVDGIVRDITVRKLADERLIRLSYYDELTGLANRRLFLDRLQQTLNLAFRNKSSVALFYLDLDAFKAINDTMGHAAGDEILKEASRRLISTLRDSDVAARLGGDEFALLLPGADADAAEQVAKKIMKMFRKPYLLGETTAALGASIGIAIYPKNGREGETLISHADAAMYFAKKNNIGFSFYGENMDQVLDHYV